MPKEEIIEQLEDLTVVELNELVTELEDRWDVSAQAAAAPVAVAGGEGGDGGGAEEQTEFDVVLQDFGDSKLDVIKAIRKITGMGIKDAKELVDDAPSTVKEAVGKGEADELKEQLTEAGATVELE